MHVFICIILGVKLKQPFLKHGELSLELEKDSTKEETKSAVYRAGIGQVLECSKSGPAQGISFVT